MKTAENITLKSIPAETEESWEESLFWRFDAVFTKSWSYVIGFFVFYRIMPLKTHGLVPWDERGSRPI